MQHVQLSDRLFQQAQQRADAAGFQSVDDYVAEIVENELLDVVLNVDHVFTPEVLADLDRIRADVQSGAPTHSQAEVDEHFRRKTEAWREAHGN